MIRLAHVRKDAPGGVGLGLALIRSLARLQGGDVPLNSRGDGTGCEFVVRIPFEAAAESAPLSTPLPNPTASRRSLSAVIVEDNPDFVQSLALAIECAGHRVSSFADGKAALAGFEHLAPDVVLLDSGLPGISGYEVLARLRDKPHLSRTRFIGISGRAGLPGPEVDGNRFDDIVLKPINIKELLRRSKHLATCTRFLQHAAIGSADDKCTSHCRMQTSRKRPHRDHGPTTKKNGIDRTQEGSH